MAPTRLQNRIHHDRHEPMQMSARVKQVYMQERFGASTHTRTLNQQHTSHFTLPTSHSRTRTRIHPPHTHIHTYTHAHNCAHMHARPARQTDTPPEGRLHTLSAGRMRLPPFQHAPSTAAENATQHLPGGCSEPTLNVTSPETRRCPANDKALPPTTHAPTSG